ncbi:hypothetical protein sscle_01g010300 [Sclerotinia sclerotiorum 1980 UF-70]|uniref:Uncharacterized protein n=1 Tax=Sclerotinia sclerotiorum (strain ATCC 18683 / 1980 / Ss-1) TaxID=665079 RepID=A0A1D9PUC1_SCLS1|nr:hypothetical protein sscle_01g010300 [Sclerotinia sclerotiorum 1980 UF-70]
MIWANYCLVKKNAHWLLSYDQPIWTQSQRQKTQPKAVKSETRLTFGVEIEYLLATVHPIHPSPDPRDPPSMLWTSATGDLPSDDELETNWLLKHDATVLGIVRVDPYYREFGMEMSSPPYYYDEASREVAFMFMLAGYQQKFCRAFPWGTFGQANPDITRLDFLNHILSSESYEQLIIDFTTEFTDRLGFNIGNLTLPYKSSKRTIEFRLHQGTLDPDAILHFTHLCIKLTEKACLTKNQEAHIGRLRTDVEKPIGLGVQECSTVDLLMWLGCPAQAYYYGIAMVATDAKKFKERIEQDTRLAREQAQLAYERWVEARRKEKAFADEGGRTVRSVGRSRVRGRLLRRVLIFRVMILIIWI